MKIFNIMPLLLFLVFSTNHSLSQDILRGDETCKYKPAVPSNNGSCLKGDWVLVFEDEFKGNNLNKDIWYTHTSYGDLCHENEPQIYLDDNVVVQNGTVSLTFKEQPGYYDNCHWTTQWKQYTSGMICSKKDYNFGIFEAKVKIPKGTGYWPAFWLWGTEGEIDIFEFYDDESAPEFTVHRTKPNNYHKRCTYVHNSTIDYSSSFHTYTVYWDPYFIAFYIDGDLKYIHWLWISVTGQTGITCYNLQAYHPYMISKSFPYGRQHVILNLAGQEGAHPYPLNKKMEVQYVRIWQKKEDACDDKYIHQVIEDTITGNSIYMDATVEPYQNKIFRAQQKIIMGSGTHIKQGACFNANVIDLLCSPSISFKQKGADNNRNLKPTIDFSKIDSLQTIARNACAKNTDDIEIYPNPFHNEFIIQSHTSGSFDIFNASGIKIISKTFFPGKNSYQFESLKNGVYILVSKSKFSHRTTIKKIIKID